VVQHEAGDLDKIPHPRFIYDSPDPVRIGLMKNLCRDVANSLAKSYDRTFSIILFPPSFSSLQPSPIHAPRKKLSSSEGCALNIRFPENGDVFANAHRLIVCFEGRVEPVVASSFFKSATPRNPFASTSFRTNS